MKRKNRYVNPAEGEYFQFKKFAVAQDNVTWKVGTDSILLGAWCDVSDAGTALDLGTGTGLLALMIAQRNSRANVTGVELDGHTADVARSNFANSHWAGRLSVIAEDVTSWAGKCALTYDLIVSNPPYIASGDIECLAPDIREYEPRMALDGGVDGLDVYRRWIPHFLPLLAKGGALMLEIGHDQGVAVSGLLADSGYVSGIEVVRDYARLERVVMCCRV